MGRGNSRERGDGAVGAVVELRVLYNQVACPRSLKLRASRPASCRGSPLARRAADGQADGAGVAPGRRAEL